MAINNAGSSKYHLNEISKIINILHKTYLFMPIKDAILFLLTTSHES